MSGNRRKKTEAEEVEELLRVAEDDVLLKLSLDSHLKSDKAIDPDLDHRFQALKSRRSKPKPKPKPNSNPNRSSSSVVLPNPPPVTGDFDTGDHEKPEADDLFARFAALKGTIPSYSSSSTTTAANSSDQQRKSNDDDDEDEVDKVIRWAIDAARLDPSPSSSSSDDNDDDIHSDDTDDEDSVDGKHKGHRK